MNILLFIVTLAISFIVVRIGAVSFHLTGLEWSISKFQALSCFSGTGFTTKEAELIVTHPQRRKIASILMISGNVGLVTLIATFANSLRPTMTLSIIDLPFLRSFMPASVLPVVNLLVILIASYAIFRIFTAKKVTDRLTAFFKKSMEKKKIIKQFTYSDIAVIGKKHGITQVKVTKDSPVIDKTVMDSGLRKKDILVLAVENKNENIYNPSADTVIKLGDKLTCFGELDNIKESI
ncbi:MAG: TrkA C-terminal domain-containing protein [Elusimicrobiota bacterium]